jgi:hypothetical protein
MCECLAMYGSDWLDGDDGRCVGARRVFGCLELEVLGISEVRERLLVSGLTS